MTAVAGENLRLKCPVAGYPIEEIKWERGGRELPDDLRQKVLPDGTLIVAQVQKSSDSGVYTCAARNKQGHSARRSGEVAVIGKVINSLRDNLFFSSSYILFSQGKSCAETQINAKRVRWVYPIVGRTEPEEGVHNQPLCTTELPGE